MRTTLLGAILGSLAGTALSLAGAVVAMALGIMPDDRYFLARVCCEVLAIAGLAIGALGGATQVLVGGSPTRTILAVGLGESLFQSEANE